MSCDHKFIGSNRCAKCGATFDLLGEGQPTYTDDVIAVMRDTISALREQLAELRQANEELRSAAARLKAVLEGSPLPEGM